MVTVAGYTVMEMRLAVVLALVAPLGACTGISSDPGEAETLASAESPGDVAVVGDDLYFVSGGRVDAYRVMHISTPAVDAPEVLGTYGTVNALAADADGAYWLANIGGYSHMMAWAPSMTAPVELFENPTFANGFTLRNIVLDASAVYYTDQTGAIWKIPKSGSGATQIGTTDGVGALAMSPDGVWVATSAGAKRLPAGPELTFGGARPDSLAWDDGALFAAYSGSGDTDGSVVRVTLDGGPETLATRLVLPGSLTAYAGYVYLTTGNLDSAIRRVPYSGGGSQALAQGRWPSGLDVDDTYVYFGDWQNDRIRRVPH